MSTPADDTFSFVHSDITYSCIVRAGHGGGMIADGQLVQPDKIWWFVTVDGREYRTVEATSADQKSHASIEDLKRRILSSLYK